MASVASDTIVVQSSPRPDVFPARPAAAQPVEQPSHFESLVNAVPPARESRPARTDMTDHSAAPVRRDEGPHAAHGADATAKSAKNPPDQKGAKDPKPTKIPTVATGAKDVRGGKDAESSPRSDESAASQAPASPAQGAAPTPTATSDQDNAANAALKAATAADATSASTADGTTTPTAAPDKAKSSDRTTSDQSAAARIDPAIAPPAPPATPDAIAVVTPVPAPPVQSTMPAAAPSGAAPLAALAAGNAPAGSATPALAGQAGLTDPGADKAKSAQSTSAPGAPAAAPATPAPLVASGPEDASRPKEPPADGKGAVIQAAVTAARSAIVAQAEASDPHVQTPASATGDTNQSSAAAAQNANLLAAAHVPPAPTLSLVPARAGDATDNAVPIAGLAVEIASRAQNGQRHFDIRLDPPELGRIDVHLDVDSNGHITSHLVADRPDTLDLLKRDAPTLERALQSAGLKTDDGGMQFSLRDQSFAGGNPTARDNPAAISRLVVPDPELPPVDAAVRGYGRLAGFGTGVDIRV